MVQPQFQPRRGALRQGCGGRQPPLAADAHCLWSDLRRPGPAVRHAAGRVPPRRGSGLPVHPGDPAGRGDRGTDRRGDGQDPPSLSGRREAQRRGPVHGRRLRLRRHRPERRPRLRDHEGLVGAAWKGQQRLWRGRACEHSARPENRHRPGSRLRTAGRLRARQRHGLRLRAQGHQQCRPRKAAGRAQPAAGHGQSGPGVAAGAPERPG